MTYLRYRAYIKSDAWKLVRQRYMASNRPKVCCRCKTPYRTGFHLHHLTYERLGHERLTDLVLCCPSCHKEIHKRYNKIKLERRKRIKSLKLAVGLTPKKVEQVKAENKSLKKLVTLESLTKNMTKK